jgi:nucleoside-diphosphate-sugar epimerase
MRKIFLTGISGMLGINLANELLARGYYVRGALRNKKNYRGNLSENLELIETGLFDDFAKYLADTDIVVHIAAETSMNILEYSHYHKINCEAVTHIYEASVRKNVKRFIFISTANTIGYGSLERPGKEEYPIKYPFDKLFYAISKDRAERKLRNIFMHKGGCNSGDSYPDIIILNPTFILGEHDYKPGSSRIISMGLGKRFLFCPPGGKNFVYAGDVVAGIINAFDKGISGERYLICNENLTFKEFFVKLAYITQKKTTIVTLPRFIMKILGYSGDLLRLMHLKCSMSSATAKILSINGFYTNDKSKNELGIKYADTETAITAVLHSRGLFE